MTDAGADEGLDIAARIWDDLVDMEQFWTHAALAVVELVAGTVALMAIASCLGAPTLRCVSFSGILDPAVWWLFVMSASSG